jgi:hypothetical protein
MAAVTDYANEAGAITAGYKKVQIDRGATYSPRFITHLEKLVTGAGMSGGRQVGTGTSDASAAAADTVALSARVTSASSQSTRERTSLAAKE